MMKKIRVSLLIVLMILITIPFNPTVAELPIPSVYRGANYIDIDNGDGSFTWSSASQWVYDGSEYVPYIYTEEDQYYSVQSGLIGARIYKAGYAEFWDPQMKEVRLYEEIWEIQYWTGSKWSVCDTYSPIFDVFTDTTSVVITASFITDWPNSGERALDIKYIFVEGQPLKHEIVFTSHSTETYDFRVVQRWAGIVADKVNENEITSLEVVDESLFIFINNGEFVILEDQWQAVEWLEPVEVDVHAQGLKADFIFSNWTLTQDESLVIDPTTTTFQPPSLDGYIEYKGGVFDSVDTTGHLIYGEDKAADYHWFRSYLRFDVTAIPDYMSITTATFSIYHWNNLQDGAPEGNMELTEISDIGATLTSADWNRAVLQNYGILIALAQRATYQWYSKDVTASITGTDTFVSFRIKDSIEDSDTNAWRGWAYSADEDGGVPANRPKLVVTYVSPASTINSASITDMDTGDNCYEMRKYYTFQTVIENDEGADVIANVSLRIMNGAVVLTEVNASTLDGVPGYAISIGAAIIDLDTGSCSWGEAGDVGTLTLKIRFEWDFVDIADLELSVYTEDTQGNATGWTEMQTDYFDVIGRLVTSGLAGNVTYVNPGGGVEASGTIYYATIVGGDVASAFYPPNAQFDYVAVHNSTHHAQGTNDSGVVNGEFAVDFSAPAGVGTYTYHIYVNMTGDYADGDLPDGDTFFIIVVSSALMLPFDDEVGTIAYDWGGSDNDGTMYGAYHVPCGLYGRAVEFDGVDDYINITFSSTLNITSEIFISAWIKTGDADRQGILNKNGSYGLSVLANQALRFTINATNLDTAPGMFTADEWTFVAARYNGSFMAIFVGSQEVASQAATGGIWSNNTHVIIGDSTYFFNGTIDEVRILDSVPSLAEIVGLMWTPIANFPYILQEYILDMDAGDWVFVDETYHFVGEYVRQNASFPMTYFGFMFTDGVGFTTFTFNGTSDDWDVSSDGAYMVLGDDSSICNTYTIDWEVYLTEGLFDDLDVDLWGYCEDNETNSDGWEVVAEDYVNTYNDGGETEYEYSGDGISIQGEGVFGLAAEDSSHVNGTGSSWAYANITWRKLQHVAIQNSWWQGTTWDDLSKYWNCPSEHAETGYVMYGIGYNYNESWVDGFYVNITITDGAAGLFPVWKEDQAWVELNVSWYNNNEYVSSDTIYVFYEAIDQNDILTTQFSLYVDLWIGLEDGSSQVGGRVRAVHFGMNESGIGPWANWAPVSQAVESTFNDYLLDSDDNVINAGSLEMFVAWANLTKVAADAGAPDCDDHQWALIDYDALSWNRLYQSNTMRGIITPVGTPTTTPENVQGGFFAALLAGMIDGIAKPIVAALSAFGGVLYFIAAALIDIVFAGFGIDNFMDTISGLITMLATRFVASVLGVTNFMRQILILVFSMTDFMLYWMTQMISFVINLFTIVVNILNGTQSGLGAIVDVWGMFEISEWIVFIPTAIFLTWIIAIDSRTDRGAGIVGVVIGDLQMANWILMFMVEWMMRAYNTAMDLIFRIINARRGG